jgi:Ni/Co efflux regulator RcnB
MKRLLTVVAAALVMAAMMALMAAPAFATITKETQNKPMQGNPQGSGNGLTVTCTNGNNNPPGQNNPPKC